MSESMTFMEPATAARIIRKLDTHSPVEWEDYLNISSAFFVLGETDLALLNARQALSLRRSPEALLNLAVILESQGKFSSALPLSREAYDSYGPIDPVSRTVACHYSDALLRMGRFEEAGQHQYTWSHADWRGIRRHIPEWDGIAPLDDKRVLVLPGGGYGDEILFLRWLPRLAALGALTTYMCMPDFMPLICDLSYIHRMIPGSVSGFTGEIRIKDYDYFLCTRSLITHFCPYPGRIPTQPYLFADPKESRQRREMLRIGDWPLVGLCTRAGEESFPRRHRTLSEEQTARILDARKGRGFEFVSLNYQDSILPGYLQPAIRDWSDTAAILSALDLVVTVDTGVAHLAGAMGIPAYVILPGISAAYYGTTGSTCWFYPSHRLFRNHAEGIDNSITAVCAALQEYA